MKIYIYVGLGGAIGSILRYVVSFLSIDLVGGSFPFGTIFVNLTGSFVLGWFTSKVIMTQRLHPHHTAAIGTGLIGSFTTLSTVSVDFLSLIEHNQYILAFLYTLVSVLGGLLSTYYGLKLGKSLKEGVQT
jgi:fluoride exporter